MQYTQTTHFFIGARIVFWKYFWLVSFSQFAFNYVRNLNIYW